MLTKRLHQAVLTSKQRKNLKASEFVVPPGMASDGRGHFPIHDVAHARNARARVMQLTSSPPWFKGSLAQLRRMVFEKTASRYDFESDEEKKSSEKSSLQDAIDCFDSFLLNEFGHYV